MIGALAPVAVVAGHSRFGARPGRGPLARAPQVPGPKNRVSQKPGRELPEFRMGRLSVIRHITRLG